MSAEFINLLEAVSREAEGVGSLFRDTLPGQDALWEFLDVNGWFGVEHIEAGRNTLVATMEPMKDALDLWLKAYNRSQGEKIDLMLDAYEHTLPLTCQAFQRFVQEADSKEQDSTWKLLDFLLSELDREITDYDDNDVHTLIMKANQELSLTGMYQLTDFLNMANQASWSYQFQSRQIVKLENSAYSLDQFAVMAYTVFNTESWLEHRLVEKAVETRKYAELWLFVALYFVCVIRKTDLARLPVPALPYEPQEVRARILQNRFTASEARSISQELMFRLEMKPMKPNKTRRSGNVPNVKLFIPESTLVPFGIILALSLSWREPEDPFVSTNVEIPDVRAFVGADFAAAVGERRFLSRRANKAYFQGIELAADAETGVQPKGYMLAALARSHKGGIGQLAEITDVYLRDASFSGYTPEFILREMFERGIFGFIPALLLENYAGREYLELDVTSLTQLVKAIGLDALQLETITSSVMKSFHKVEVIVRSLVLERGEEPGRLAGVLQNIAAGAAPSKQPEYLCLRSAAGYPCFSPDRSCCIGCGYEIYTKSAMHLLTKEYVRLSRDMDTAGDFQRARIQRLLEDGILPAITEIVTSIPMFYLDAEMDSFYQIMERGISDTDHSPD